MTTDQRFAARQSALRSLNIIYLVLVAVSLIVTVFDGGTNAIIAGAALVLGALIGLRDLRNSRQRA